MRKLLKDVYSFFFFFGTSKTLSRESMDDIVNVATEMKSIEHYFPVILFIVLYKTIQNLEPVTRSMKFDNLSIQY